MPFSPRADTVHTQQLSRTTTLIQGWNDPGKETGNLRKRTSSTRASRWWHSNPDLSGVDVCQARASHEIYWASSFHRGWKCQNMLQSNSFNYLLLIPGKNRKPHVQSQLRLCAVGLRAVTPEQVRRAGQGAAGTACSHHPGGTLSSSLPPEQGWTRSSLEVPSSPYNSVILCDITRAKGFTHLLAALQKHIFSRTEHSIQWNEATWKMKKLLRCKGKRMLCKLF